MWQTQALFSHIYTDCQETRKGLLFGSLCSVVNCVAGDQVMTMRQTVVLQRPQRHNGHAPQLSIHRVTTTITAVAMVEGRWPSHQEPLQLDQNNQTSLQFTPLAPTSLFFLTEPRQCRRLSRHRRRSHRLNRRNQEQVSRHSHRSHRLSHRDLELASRRLSR